MFDIIPCITLLFCCQYFYLLWKLLIIGCALPCTLFLPADPLPVALSVLRPARFEAEASYIPPASCSCLQCILFGTRRVKSIPYDVMWEYANPKGNMLLSVPEFWQLMFPLLFCIIAAVLTSIHLIHRQFTHHICEVPTMMLSNASKFLFRKVRRRDAKEGLM